MFKIRRANDKTKRIGAFHADGSNPPLRPATPPAEKDDEEEE